MKFGGMFHGFSFGAGFELVRRIVVPAILVAAPLMLWWWLGPEKPKCDDVRTHAAKVAAIQVANRIHAERGDVRRATVLHFKNDPTDFITTCVREQLMNSGILDLDGTPPGEKIRSLFNLRNAGVYDVQTALEYGKSRELDAVIIGAVDLFETVKGKAVLKGGVKFINVATGNVVDIPLTDKIIPGAGIDSPDFAEITPLWQRLIYMVLLIAALPVLLFPFLKLVMRKDSNMATAALLVSLLAVDGLIINIMLGTRATFSGMALFLISLAGSFGYDLFMLSYAQLCRPAVPSV